MFTFSFGSAFATVSWTGEATSKTLNEAGDYDLNSKLVLDNSKTGDGAKGITEAYRAQLNADAKAELKHAKEAGTFYAPEKAAAVAAIEAYIEALKTVKTAKDADKLTKDLENKVGSWGAGKLTEKVENGKLVSLPTQELVRALAGAAKDGTATANGVSVTATEAGIATVQKTPGAGTAGDAVIDLTKKAERADADDLYLPGYVRLVNDTDFAKITTSVTTSTLKVNSAEATIKSLFDDYSTQAKAAAVVDWLMDNNYRAATDFTTGTKAFVTALVVVNNGYKDTFEKAGDAIQLEIDKYVDKADENTRRGLGVSEAEGIDALVKKINDFQKTYKGFKDDFLKDAKLKDAIKGNKNAGLAVNYFDQYYTEVTAVPEVKKLTDADKATVVALYKKVMALEDSYSDIWDYVSTTSAPVDAANYAWDFNKVKNAYEHFLKADVKAFDALEGFAVATKGNVDGTTKYYFDASEKNVSAVKAKRAAYDALVSNYGYADLNKTLGGIVYENAAKAEALILAAEHNQGADAAYDVKDTKKLQAYLNNATLKVTTKALGNSKIRVNARFDAETYKDIVAECGNDYTISYKFYQKSAKATSFKGPKEKSRNYITYSKASLKKGTKYKFQCGVVIKDAQGNVVAEKSYKASTTGSRICR